MSAAWAKSLILAIIVALGCLLGIYLEVGRGLTAPSLYWFLGGLTVCFAIFVTELFF